MNVNMIHEKKVNREYFDDMASGIKPYEICIDDRNPAYSVGDIIVFKEWMSDPLDILKVMYSGRSFTAEITYKLTNCAQYGLADGYCILGLRVMPKPPLEIIPYPQSRAGKRIFVEKELSQLLIKANTGWVGAEYVNVALGKEYFLEYIYLISESGYRSAPIDVTADNLQMLIFDVFKVIQNGI